MGVWQAPEEWITDWTQALQRLIDRIGPCFQRPEPRRRVGRFVAGLLSGVERRNGWQLAEHAGEATPDGMQRLLYQAKWDADAGRCCIWMIRGRLKLGPLSLDQIAKARSSNATVSRWPAGTSTASS